MSINNIHKKSMFKFLKKTAGAAVKRELCFQILLSVRINNFDLVAIPNRLGQQAAMYDL